MLLWEAVLPEELLRLSEELGRVDALVDDVNRPGSAGGRGLTQRPRLGIWSDGILLFVGDRVGDSRSTNGAAQPARPSLQGQFGRGSAALVSSTTSSSNSNSVRASVDHEAAAMYWEGKCPTVFVGTV